MKTNDITFSDQLKVFRGNQQELASILTDASNVTRRLNMTVEEELANLGERVKNDTFKVMVTGTFKNGKSALINALLGEKVLPSYALPCTAVINEIKYGETKRAVLHFKKKIPFPLPENLASKAIAHMKKYKGREIPPMEIPYDKLEEYSVIPVGADADQMRLQTPYEKIEVFYPLEILKNGIEIIDSPGLNEDEARTRTTVTYLERVDAILYVFNANAIAAASELDFVRNDLAGNNYESVIFAINKIDQIDEDQREAIHQYAVKKLSKIYPSSPVFSISAKTALNARDSKDQGKLKASGFLEMEGYLSEFLTAERGKAKLMQPAKRVRQILSVDAVGKTIPSERAMLEKSLEAVRKQEEALRPKIRLLEQEMAIKRCALNEKIELCAKKVRRMSKEKMLGLADSVRTWVDEFQPTKPVPTIPTQKKFEPVITEIVNHVKGKIKEAQVEWQQTVLIPELEKNVNGICKDAEKDFGKIFAAIDELEIEISGIDKTKMKKIPFWERAAGVAGGLLIGDIGLAVSGGINGIGKELAKTAAIEVGAGALLFLLGMLNPFTIILTLTAVIIRSIVAGKKHALSKLKESFIPQIAKSIIDNADDQSEKFYDSIKSKLGGVADQITKSIGNELADMSKRLKSAVEEKASGEKRCAQRKMELTQCEAEIASLNTRLDTLIFKLV